MSDICSAVDDDSMALRFGAKAEVAVMRVRVRATESFIVNVLAVVVGDDAVVL